MNIFNPILPINLKLLVKIAQGVYYSRLLEKDTRISNARFSEDRGRANDLKPIVGKSECLEHAKK